MTSQQEARLAIRIGRVSDTHGPDSYVITVTDEASRIRVVEARLTATQFAEAVTGLGADDVQGELLPQEVRHRLGHRMENYSVALPRVSENACEEWAGRANMVLHADTVRHSRTNSGWRVDFRWYLPPNHVGIDMEQARKLTPPVPSAR